MSLYRCIACSKGIIPAIADGASCETILKACVMKMRKDLWIYCSLHLARLDIEILQASKAYVMTGSMAYLWIIIRLWNDIPHVAFEQRTRLLRICINLFSRYCVWGYPSNLQSNIIPRYLIFETIFIPHATIVEWRLKSSLFPVNIGIRADLSLEISSFFSLHQSSMVWIVVRSVWRMAGREGSCIMTIMSSAKTTIFRFGALKSSAIRSLIIIFHKVGPETDSWGHPLVTPLSYRNFLVWGGPYGRLKIPSPCCKC